MLFVIFTYNREQMLKALINEISAMNKSVDEHGYTVLTSSNRQIIVIDDGSDWLGSPTRNIGPYCFQCDEIIRTIHEGKQGFWKKWLLARQIALGTDHEYFCFLPDDVSNIDLKAIEEITKQGWTDRLFALNLLNAGECYRWGQYKPIQEDFTLAGRVWQQCDYVDGAFVTNRTTLQAFDIEPVTSAWFDRPDKSSGVGYQMTQKLRALGCPMMLPDISLAFHGDHESVMHKEHRKTTKLISK